ncbi:MAG: DUF1501 domain-containing protein [Puniceicoccaceae bacterium]
MDPNLILPRTTRRAFLHTAAKAASFLAFSRVAPAFVAHAAEIGAPPPEKDRTILVLLQLAGGNDGLNTVIPFEDSRYYNLRPNLSIPRGRVLPLDDYTGFHPECELLKSLFEEGDLSIIRSVGYPNPNRSHFRSTEIWETAVSGSSNQYTGWLGRYFDNDCDATPENQPAAIYFGTEGPLTLEGAEPHFVLGVGDRKGAGPADGDLLRRLATDGPANPHLGFLRHTLMNALIGEAEVAEVIRQYRTRQNYGSTPFGRSMRSIAAMIASGSPTRVYYASLGGFDTHANQEFRHGRLMRELSENLAAFQADLRERKLDDQVVTLTFSEFGRRPQENSGMGTDHGTAAPLFVMGGPVKGGFQGKTPDLEVASNGDLVFETDFRQVYATVLEDWLGCDAGKVLGGTYAKLPILNS